MSKKKVTVAQEKELKVDLLKWLELYTWVQKDGSIDFSNPHVRPAGLAIDARELKG